MQVLHRLPKFKDENLLVGLDTTDDAAVYRISGDTAIVSSLDFFPPIVDDPYDFGQISAANALSDIYAMGGTPIFATNIVCFPKELDIEVLGEILRGSADKLKEAGAILAGGHSIEDKEIKYGLSVTGTIHPERIMTNGGARPGDRLLLTKPLGTGVVTSALKAGKLKIEQAVEAFQSMKELNKTAGLFMTGAGANACTDITGFGLLGHAFEMAEGSGVSLVFQSSMIEFFPHVKELVMKKKCRPRAIETNMKFVEDSLELGEAVDKATEMLLLDPQTSGGLLIAVPEARADGLIQGLAQERVVAFDVGEVVERNQAWRIKVE